MALLHSQTRGHMINDDVVCSGIYLHMWYAQEFTYILFYYYMYVVLLS